MPAISPIYCNAKRRLTIIVQCSINDSDADRNSDRRRSLGKAGPDGPKGMQMLKNFDDAQKLGKDQVDVAMKQFGAVSKGVQAIASEFADYSKKSFENGTAA